MKVRKKVRRKCPPPPPPLAPWTGLWLLLLTSGAWPVDAWAQKYEVETLQYSGPPEKRLDLVLLGDGYRSQDQQQLHTDAQRLVETLFQLTPFKEYRALFNVHLIHVISKENGADSGTYGTVRDTALNAAYNCNGIARLLCVDTETVKTVAAQHVPTYDLLVVLVNDPRYGGAGGEVATVSLATAASEIVRHELGHSLGALADEYSDPYPAYPACPTTTDCPEPNATLHSARATLKWAQWVEPSTPVPTPSTGTSEPVGAYEGCRYKSSGLFRPKDGDCLMRALTHPYCPVCTEALVKSFWNLASPIDVATPSGDTATVTPCGPVTFSVTPPFPSDTWGYLWTVDGTPQENPTPSFSLAPSQLPQGAHKLSVMVSDNTPLVRNDPFQALKETQTWNVAFTACTPGPCDVTAACDSSGACARTYRPEGTPCGGGVNTCQDGLKQMPAACSADGTCHASTPVSCGAYTCDDAGADCRTTCTEDRQCTANNLCLSGVCQPQAPITPPRKTSCLGCTTGDGLGNAALGLWLLAWAVAKRRQRPAPL